MPVEVLVTWGVVGYLFGSIPSGYVLVKLFMKQDVRQRGSGNIGATNVLRIGNRKLALLTYILDTTKIWVPMFLFNWLMNPIKDLPVDILTAFLMIIGAAGIVGHMYSCWLKFDGGKGVASLSGYFIWLFPYGSLIGFVVFLIVVFSTRIVSLSSLISVISMAAYVIFYVFPTLDTPTILMAISKIFFVFVILLIFWRHKQNIHRLIKGEEHKIKF